jgi:hypothetical protein
MMYQAWKRPGRKPSTVKEEKERLAGSFEAVVVVVEGEGLTA